MKAHAIRTYLDADSVRRMLRTVMIVAVVLATEGCGTVRYHAGREFNVGSLENTLKVGSSTQTDVRAALGEPYGQGGAMLAWHDAPRTVWTYYYETGQVDLGGSDSHSRRSYLFVFYSGDKFDSYMWFATSALPPGPR